MIVQYELIRLEDFQAWSGAVSTQMTIYKADKGEEFMQLINELYPNGINETQLNDILWFEEEWLFEELGIVEEGGE